MRTVVVGYMPRKALHQAIYRSVPLEEKEVAVQRLVLVVPVEEIKAENVIKSSA